jgi:hypothetical protein
MDIIIPRALYWTNEASFEADIRKLEDLYTPEQITAQLANTREKISNEVRRLVANRYHVALSRRLSPK